MATDVATALTLVRVAAAVHGLSLSGPALAARVAQAGSFPGGVGAFVDAHVASEFGGLTAADAAALVVRNLGLPASVAEAAAAYLEQQVFGRPSAGQALVGALERLSELTTNPQFGAAAVLFNSRVQAAQDRLLQPSGVDASWAGLLTLGLAGAGLGGFALSAVSGVNTLVLVGSPSSRPAGSTLEILSGALPDLRRIELVDTRVDLQLRHLAKGGLVEGTEFVLSGTGPGTSIDLRFDTLASQVRSSSILLLELMDTRAATSADPQIAARPLRDSPYDGIAFRVNGQVVRLEDPVTADPSDPTTLNGAQTYAQLLAAVQALLTRPDVLAQYPVLKGFSAALGPSFEARDTLTGGLATGTAIMIMPPAGSSVTLSPVALIARDGVPPSTSLFFVMRVQQADVIAPVTGRITLDGVGRGGPAGPLIIGLEDGATGANPAGVQHLKLAVDGDSRLTSVSSTGGALLEVTATGGRGGLQLLGDDGQAGWRPGAAAAGDFGLVDVRTVDLSAMVAPMAVDVLLTAAAASKLARAGQAVTEVEISGGKGADELWVQVSPSLLLGDRSTPPVSVTVDGGPGADHIVVAIGDLSGGPLPAPGALRRGSVEVQGGAGNDDIDLAAPTIAVSVVMQMGFGHDVIRGFDAANDRLDLRALGGQGGRVTALPAEPSAQSLRFQSQAIVGAREGPGTDSAAEVARLFLPAVGTSTLDAQVYIAVDERNVGHVYRIELPAGGPLTAQLVGQIELVDTSWATLTSTNFG